MASHRTYLAIDLGASSGRHVAGLLDDDTLRLVEVHRFQNGPVRAGGHLNWDVLAQWSQVQKGLRAAASAELGQIVSMGVDTWGVDFGLLGPGDELLANPVHYRDARTDGLLERAYLVVPRERIFAETGLQFMQFNTLYQLWALRLGDSATLDAATHLLMMGDLFHWLLTGEKSNEFTNATTTQFFNPLKRTWSRELLGQFDIPDRILGAIAEPGTVLGPLRNDVAQETGLHDTRVVLPGTHDTASAVVAVPACGAPAQPPEWCYISSGTWSLMGAEVPSPIINETCLKLNFTNEGGVGGTTRLLKNIAGLWLIQECRRVWNEAGHAWSWSELLQMADAAEPLVSLVDPDHSDFLLPTSMPDAICDFCRRSGQVVPEDPGAIVRTAIESLAMRYRLVLGWLEQLIGGRISDIHVVGGGSQNVQLCQATADACQRAVLAGPVEATAIGNVLVQAIAAGQLGSIAEAREVVRRSFPVTRYEPRNAERWDEAFERFAALVIP